MCNILVCLQLGLIKVHIPRKIIKLNENHWLSVTRSLGNLKHMHKTY